MIAWVNQTVIMIRKMSQTEKDKHDLKHGIEKRKTHKMKTDPWIQRINRQLPEGGLRSCASVLTRSLPASHVLSPGQCWKLKFACSLPIPLPQAGSLHVLTSQLQRLPLLPSGRAQGVSHRMEVEGDGVMLRALGVPVGQLRGSPEAHGQASWWSLWRG